MLLEGGALTQPLEPGLDRREAWSLDRHAHPALHLATDGNVAHREGRAADILRAGQVLLQHRQQPGGLLAPGRDRVHVALFRRRAHEAPEHVPHRALEREGPVHPALGVGPSAEIRGPQHAGAVLGTEVAHDAVRLPQDEAVILYRRHERIRVHLHVLRRFRHAVVHARVGTLVFQAELFGGPQRLLDVHRVNPAPDLQHIASIERPEGRCITRTSRPSERYSRRRPCRKDGAVASLIGVNPAVA